MSSLSYTFIDTYTYRYRYWYGYTVPKKNLVKFQ
jgi:hypothetical protein